MFEIVTVAAGLSEDSTTSRLAARLAAATASALETTAPEVTVTEIDLRTLAKEMVTITVSGLPSPALEDAFAAVQRADALITVAPIYNSQPVGLQTLFFQLIDDAALAGTPVLIGSTGGTARHSLAAETSLRPLLSYLKAIIVPTAVFAATDDWGADASGMGNAAASPNGSRQPVPNWPALCTRCAQQRQERKRPGRKQPGPVCRNTSPPLGRRKHRSATATGRSSPRRCRRRRRCAAGRSTHSTRTPSRRSPNCSAAEPRTPVSRAGKDDTMAA